MNNNISLPSDFYKTLRNLALPLVVQNILSAIISSVDVIMLNFVGQSAVSAASLAVQYSSILFMVLYGLGTGASILCAQYFGKKDFNAIAVVQGIAMRFAILFGGLFTASSFLIPELMMKPFTNDAELIHLGAEYLRYVSVSFISWAIIETYFSVLKSCGQVTICTVLNVCTNALNIFLNAAFIFGWFGITDLGIKGVALATSISRLAQLGAVFVYSALSKNIRLSFIMLFVRNKVLFKDFMKISLPALGNDVSWGLAFSVYSAIIGHLGSDAVAAYSFVGIARNFGQIFCFAIASAGGILVGQILGNNQIEESKLAAKKIMNLTIITGLIGGLIILASTPLILKFAKISPVAHQYLKTMLFINTYYVMGSAVNTTLIAGVFRAGGDAKWGLICDTIDMWGYAVPIGLLSAFVFKLPVIWVYVILCTDEFVKWPWVISHYRSGKWAKNITRDNVA